MNSVLAINQEEIKARRLEFVKNNQQNWIHIGQRCKKLRMFYNKSVVEIAGSIGVSETTIRNFEKGKPITNADTIEKAYLMYIELSTLRRYLDEFFEDMGNKRDTIKYLRTEGFENYD